MRSKSSRKAKATKKTPRSGTVADTLGKLINAKRAVVGVIGMGYVGLPLALEFCKSGFCVIGFDTDNEKVKDLNEGRSYIGHISSTDVKSFSRASMFSATSDFSRLAEADCITICVPTPLNEQKEPYLGYVAQTAESIAQTLRKGQLIVLESTTYPGTTRELALPGSGKHVCASGR